MKKITVGFLLLALVLIVGVGGTSAYHLSTSSSVTLIVYMGSEESPALLQWGAEKALYVFHPTEDEVRQLNAEAGARYAALYPDRPRAEKLLAHFLANGVDVNAIDRATGSGVTALHSAVLDRNPYAVNLLLAYGADATVTGKQGRTPLDFAILLQDKDPGADMAEIIQLLTPAQG